MDISSWRYLVSIPPSPHLWKLLCRRSPMTSRSAVTFVIFFCVDFFGAHETVAYFSLNFFFPWPKVQFYFPYHLTFLTIMSLPLQPAAFLTFLVRQPQFKSFCKAFGADEWFCCWKVKRLTGGPQARPRAGEWKKEKKSFCLTASKAISVIDWGNFYGLHYL